MKSRLYYEAHVTIDPVAEERRNAVQELADPYGCKLAKLLMQKGQPSNLDTFMTCHGRDLMQMEARVAGLVRRLQAVGLRVRRYKIEDTLMDSRHEDELGLGVTPDKAVAR